MTSNRDDIVRIEFQRPYIRGHRVWHVAITDPRDHRKLGLSFFIRFREQGLSEDGNVIPQPVIKPFSAIYIASAKSSSIARP